MNNLTLIIPAKNEKDCLPTVLDELKRYNLNIHVILEESDRKTIEAISEYNCKIIYQNQKGYGDALIEGINSVKSEYFCIFNADGSFDPKELSLMFKKIDKNKCDFIFGSRYEQNSGSDDDTIITKIGNYIFTKIGNIFFDIKITDILYTYVIGNTDQAKKLDLRQKDFRFCVELPIKAQKQSMKLGTFNCYERKRIAGKKKVNALKDGYLILSQMIKLFFEKK